MAVSAPGLRLFGSLPLAFTRRSATRRGGRRASAASLSLTSMIDFLVVMVVFLLTTFSPSAEGSANVGAFNVQDLMDAPTVVVRGREVFLDGRLVDTTAHVDSAGRVERMEGLGRALQAKAATWKDLNPGKPAPGAVVLQLDKDTPALTTKSVFLTATRAGFPAVSFMVQKAGAR
jgi:biopolymer transport protein ExbD